MLLFEFRAIGEELAASDDIFVASGGFYGVGRTVAESYEQHRQLVGKASNLFHILPVQDQQVPLPNNSSLTLKYCYVLM